MAQRDAKVAERGSGCAEQRQAEALVIKPRRDSDGQRREGERWWERTKNCVVGQPRLA